MSGLDKMKAQIIAEAQENAKEILAQAHAQADSIIGEAKAQAEKDARKIVAQAEARAEDSVKRLASSSDMRKRKAVLEAKQSESLMMQLILQCLKRFLRSMYFREKEPSVLQRKTENVCLRGIWKKYMKQRRRKAEAWNLQRQCRTEWMGDLS